MAEGLKISIVTPSYNQGEFLEETICSILDQGYPDLEYIIIDGGSTDNSPDIIKKYEKYLAYWVSEKDNGQAHAINKGFSRATGEIFAYLNADDKYCPWALKTINNIFSDCTEVQWLVSLWQLHWNVHGDPTPGMAVPGYTRKAFFEGRTLGNSDRFLGWIQQESTFWRKNLWQKAGGFVNEDLKYAMDFELWSRFYALTDLYGVSVPLGGFRQHPCQKTSDGLQYYFEEAKGVLENISQRSKSVPERVKNIFQGKNGLNNERPKNIGFDYALARWKCFELKHATI